MESGSLAFPHRTTSISNMTSTGPMQLSSKPDRIDIIFAYANSFGSLSEKKEFHAMSDREIINPDFAFNGIVKAV